MTGVFLRIAILAAAISSGFLHGADQQDIFEAGKGGYHTYRIPAIVVTTNGTVLAFCEGRKDGTGDSGRIDLLLRRSTDGGKSWEAQKLLREDGDNVCGNPTPVVDRVTGKVFLLTTWNRGLDTERMILDGKSVEGRRVFVMESGDNGATWSEPVEITASVKRPHWRWYATGPCNGIQLKGGRLLIPANHSDHSDQAKHHYRSHVFYSDDHGVSWKLGGVQEEKTNESTLVELSDGLVIQNMRSYHGRNARAIAASSDAGLTWSGVVLDTNLVDSVCQASIFRHSNGAVLFSNPAATKREKMTVRVSGDEGRTWSVLSRLHDGPSAYSCLAEIPGGVGLCLYERGEKTPYEKITFAKFAAPRSK